MQTKSNNRIFEIAHIISEIEITTQEEKSLVGLLLGAVFSLENAISLNYEDRTGENLPRNYIEELRKIAKRIELNEELEEREWLAGYYFDSAVQRLAALNERVSKYIFGKKQDISSVIRREVNRMKHDIEGILSGRTANVEDALKASLNIAELLKKYCAEPNA